MGKPSILRKNAAALQFIIDAYHQGYVVTPKELGVSYDGNVIMSEEAAMSTGGSWYVSDFAIKCSGSEREIYKKFLMRKAMKTLQAPSTHRPLHC